MNNFLNFMLFVVIMLACSSLFWVFSTMCSELLQLAVNYIVKLNVSKWQSLAMGFVFYMVSMFMTGCLAYAGFSLSQKIMGK